MKTTKCLALVAAAITMATVSPLAQGAGPLGLATGASVSALAVRVRDGKTLAQYDSNRRLTPASLTKSFTTAMAMRKLGPEARLTTTFGLRGADLVVHGSFDPTIGSRYFGSGSLAQVADSVAGRLIAKGVRQIENLEIDLSLAPLQRYGGCRLWEDIGNGYGAIPSVVMDSDNELSLFFSTPAATGAECRLDSIVPDIMSGLRPRVCVTSYAGRADKTNIFIADSALWLAIGQLPQGRKAFSVKAAAPSPEMTFARRLASLLAARGVSVANVRLTEKPEPDTTLFVHSSPTIAEIAKQTNTHSLNHYADALALHMSTDGLRSRASWDAAGEQLTNFWRNAARVKPFFRDGSGLAPYNAVSAADVVAMLKSMRNSNVWPDYKASLPRLGKEGTWAGLGADTPICGKVWAKSGSMTGVVSYGGLMTMPNGDEVLFCVIVNHFEESPYGVKKRIVDWLLHIYKTKS